MELYDVIIIGGGPTGSTSASLLAEKGYRVLVLEKEKFPREHVGESLIPLTYTAIKKMGLLDDLKKIATRKPGVSFVSANGNHQSLWCFKNVIQDESYLSFHVIRSEFDKLLLDNSKRKGAEVREAVLVKDVSFENPDGTVEVTGIYKKEVQKFKARFLIDASGQNTFLGKKLGVKRKYDDLDRVAIFNHWTNAKYDASLKEGVIKIVYLGGNKKGWCWVIPVSSTQLSIGIVIDNKFVRRQKIKMGIADLPNWQNDLYIQEIFRSSVIKKILKNATLEHKTLIIGDYSYYCEKKYGNNYAMIGDAGAFLDPIFSSGIYVGMHSAELVTEAIHQKFSGNGDSEMNTAFEKINGAVNLLEKFIRLFYSPEEFNFSMVGDPKVILYQKSKMAYTIFHHMLAGDFFENHEKYSEFMDLIRDEKTLEKFQTLIKYNKNEGAANLCGESFEKMYGEMVHKIIFDESIM